LYKTSLKIYKTQIIIVKLKKFMRKNITKNWNTTKLTKSCVKDIANTFNKIEKKSKKIDANKLSNKIDNINNKKSAIKVIKIVTILRRLI